MNLAKEVATEVADESFFGHVVNNGFSQGTAQFISGIDAVANVATCHNSNQDFLWRNGIFTPENNFRSQAYCARKGMINAIPTHNPFAIATKSTLGHSLTIPREELFDMTPQPFWSHGFIGNTTNVINTIGYGLGKGYALGYNLVHGSFSFGDSIVKIFDISSGTNPANGEVYGPPTNPANGEVYGPPTNPANGEVYGPPTNPANGEVYGPPTNPANGEVFSLPYYDLEPGTIYFPIMNNGSSTLLQLPEINVPSRFVTDNGIGYRFDNGSSLSLTPDGVTYSTDVNGVNVNVSVDASLIKHLGTEYLPTIFGNAPKEVIPLSNGATLTISRQMHGISIYKTYEINDPVNGIHIKVSEYDSSNPLQDLDDKYQVALQQKNIQNALNFKVVVTLIDGSTVTYTKEVNGTNITNKIVIHNPHTGVHIEVSEKDDPNYQETAMALYNQALQSDTYINNCRLGKLIQNTKDLTPEQVDAQRNAFVAKTGEYTNCQIHLWAHKRLLMDYELTADYATNIGVGASYMMAYNILFDKYKKYDSKWEKTKEITKDSIKTYGEIAILNTGMNHAFEEVKLLDLVSQETFGNIVPYAAIGVFTAYQLCKIKFDKKRPYMRDNDINSFILNKALQSKVGMLGKGFSAMCTSYGLLEATSKWLLFGSCGVNFVGMVLFNWMITRSISPYKDVAFATESRINRLNDKINEYNKTVKDEKTTHFEKDVALKVLEIANITKQPENAKVVFDKPHYIGIGFSYAFGGNI